MQKVSMKRIVAILSVLFLLVSTVSESFVVLAAETSNNVYVSETNGSDSNVGTSSSPVATMSVALDKVSDGGTIHVVGTVSTWSVPNKNVTITGGTIDFGEDQIIHLGMENKNITFNNISLVFNTSSAGYAQVFANGCNLTMGKGIIIKNASGVALPNDSIELYGGTQGGELTGNTNLTIYSGNYRCICGGGKNDVIHGNTNLWVGGDTNAGVNPADHDPLASIYGGGKDSTIKGSTNVTFTDNAKANYIYGGVVSGSIAKGSNVTMMGGTSMSLYGGGNAEQNSDASVALLGGEIQQLFGGCQSNNLTGNVDVKVLGGKVTRRIYGGCYNETSGLSWSTSCLVTGQITLTLGSDATISLSESGNNDQSIYARSRYKSTRSAEKSTICYADETAKSMHSGKLGSADSTMSWIMSSVSAANNTYTHTLNYTVSAEGKTLVETCSECSHTSTATIDIAQIEREYNGKAHEGATVAYARDWLSTRNRSVAYANNIKPGTATASITYGDATASVNYTISKATGMGTCVITKEDGVKYIWYDDICTYRTAKDEDGYYTQSPKLTGYVFGGWFVDDDDTNSIGTVTSGGAWAKFVPQKTFTIKAQISIAEPTSGVSFSDLLTSVEKVNLRFVTGVDSLKYQKVIFQVTHLEKTVTKEMTSVMSQIDVKTEEDDTYQSKKASDVFGTAAEYFATLRFTGIAASTAYGERYQKDWTVTPMIVTQDGTLVNGVTREGLKISDAISEKFQVASNTSCITYDNVGGTVVTTNMTNAGGTHELYFATDSETNSSRRWEITGNFEQIKSGLMNGFTIQSADGNTIGYYTMYGQSVALNEKWGSPVAGGWNNWNVDGVYVFANADYDNISDGNLRKFKAVIQDDVFSFWVEDELVWQLPLTNANFGGFAEGTSYRFALRHRDEGGQAEWSNLTVKYGEDVGVYKFLVASMSNHMTADTMNGNVTTNMTGDKATNHLYFATDNATNSSKCWEITGTFEQLAAGLMNGFTIQSADGNTTGYYTMYGQSVALNEKWGSPINNEWNRWLVDEVYVFANADYDAISDGNQRKFKAVIRDDIFSFWVEDELVWQLPLTNANFGGFAEGTSYRFALRHRDEGGQAEWSNLTVKYGEDVGEYKFLVASMSNHMTADTMNGKVIADHASTDVRNLYFATNNETNSSTSWEITGTMTQSGEGLKTFIIQPADGTKTEYYTMYDRALIKNEKSPWDWRWPSDYPEYVFNNPYYEYVSTNHGPLQFKAVIKNDIFSLWIEDQLAWSVPLTNEKFGGFAAGTLYRIAIGSTNGQGTGQVEWSDLTVKYGEDVQ